MLDKYPANFLFECRNSMDWAKDILKKSLKQSMFKNDDQKMIDKIVFELHQANPQKVIQETYLQKNVEKLV